MERNNKEELTKTPKTAKQNFENPTFTGQKNSNSGDIPPYARTKHPTTNQAKESHTNIHNSKQYDKDTRETNKQQRNAWT